MDWKLDLRIFEDTQLVIQEIASKMGLLHLNMPGNDFHFVHVLLMSFKTWVSWRSLPGKENLGLTCPKGELEFNFLSSPVTS